MKKTISGILLATGAVSLSLILASTVHSKEKVNAYVPKNEQKIIKENPKLLKLKNLPFENKRTKRMISFQSQKSFDSFLSNQKKFPIQLVFYKNTCPYCNASLPEVYKHDKKHSAYYIDLNKQANKEILMRLAGKKEVSASTIVKFKNSKQNFAYEYALEQETPKADIKTIKIAFQ